MGNKFVVVLLFSFALSGCGSLSSTNKQPATKAPLSDSALFSKVQQQVFNYFWDGAEPVSGLARERFHEDGVYPQNDKNVVTIGGGGFGVMAILVGIQHHFITREQGRQRLEKIVDYLHTADRFHGAWPHWLYGETGKVKPFSKYDDGGDLVETSFMLQGLLCVRQYFINGNVEEKRLAQKIDSLWHDVEFDWYTNNANALYWHWSPNYGWKMNFAVHGYNECLIMYVLAASSPTHSISEAVYHEGWAENGKINQSPASYGNITLAMNHQGNARGSGPLFWAHYSFLGLDPRGLKDKYADYWKHNTDHALIHYNWCVNNPKKYSGYGANNWGLTSSYSMEGYAGHAPSLESDLGVIAPTAALSSFPYTPGQSMAAMKFWYTKRNKELWGVYGFYDAFSDASNWYPKHYLAIDQGPIVVMMENHRSALLWNLFMSSPEIKQGLKKLNFQSPWLK